MALALSAAPLLGVELSAEDVLLERLAPPKLVHNVAVCSRWSPRYEALHVLPWLAHHNLLGVDHFFMYLAPPYTNASSPLELRVRALVAASPMVRPCTGRRRRPAVAGRWPKPVERAPSVSSSHL